MGRDDIRHFSNFIALFQANITVLPLLTSLTWMKPRDRCMGVMV